MWTGADFHAGFQSREKTGNPAGKEAAKLSFNVNLGSASSSRFLLPGSIHLMHSFEAIAFVQTVGE